ncbi:hypothetical protein ACJX0J_040597 [Zea mays]
MGALGAGMMWQEAENKYRLFHIKDPVVPQQEEKRESGEEIYTPEYIAGKKMDFTYEFIDVILSHRFGFHLNAGKIDLRVHMLHTTRNQDAFFNFIFNGGTETTLNSLYNAPEITCLTYLFLIFLVAILGVFEQHLLHKWSSPRFAYIVLWGFLQHKDMDIRSYCQSGLYIVF